VAGLDLAKARLLVGIGVQVYQYDYTLSGMIPSFPTYRQVAIHFMHYNWVRVHKSLRVTPAMAAGLTSRLWGLEDVVGLMEAKEQAIIGTEANKRGPYRKSSKDSN